MSDTFRRLVIIDDDPNILRSFQRFFASEYSVFTFSNASSAVALIAGMNPDVIVCDYQMKGLNGIDVYNALPPCLQRRFVFFSGQSDDPALKAMMGATGALLVHKPAAMEEICATLRLVA